ncbi:conserved hypothetical protein [Verticillium alfalfae VaMs.102]|uniref:Zn(2)-C6 fungal-type domain-containing protein n=1 Tax=Verticillium alfalfae (strain VaMs.102 / ATCC MYA-4576 / FGSC 10136) TaxID=526221 RepID=C9SY04_VERA1|nr:conserved hypothetical protein [Verticillium alfalfae VaMs.102]EEY23669.1 conserved hypothetical protein [Verticillium alfalfae VaMs.102]
MINSPLRRVPSTAPNPDPTSHDQAVSLTKPKRSRVSNAKAKTGCITCKKRHVKCDETKPHCRKCLAIRGHCEGYAPPKIPKQRGRVAVVAKTANMLQQTLLDPDLLDFHDATGLKYFNEFVKLSQAPWNVAASNGDLWSVLLPQLARANDTLRHAAMAIGAVSLGGRGTLSSELPLTPAGRGPPNYSPRELHATTYLCHALKLQSRSSSVQDTIFLSVMLLYFETLRGNIKAALNHVNHGLALLLTLTTSQEANAHIRSLAPNPGPLLGAVTNVFFTLAAQARHILTGRVGNCRPLPHFAKGLRHRVSFQEVGAFLPLFQRIMLQSHDSKDYLRALHLRLQYLGVTLFENAPQFLSIDSVRALTPLFREFLTTASAALRAARLTTDKPAYGTSLQCGLSMWLFGTALFCRDAVVRDEAVVMLSEYPGQDGLWSTRALHLLAVRNRDVEKANAVEGSDAEQWARLWRRSTPWKRAAPKSSSGTWNAMSMHRVGPW